MKKLKALAGSVAVIGLSASLLAACGSGDSGSSSADVLKAGSTYGPTSLDPINVTGGSDPSFMGLLYDRLIQTDIETNELVPGLATEWGYSEDGKTFDLTLREGVKFSDGRPVDAEAVKANLERNFEKAKLGQITTVKEVEVVSPTQVRLHLAQDFAWLAEQLAYNAGYMVSPAAFEKNPDDVSGNPIGSGPYILKDYVPGSKLVLTKNEDYWNKDRTNYETIDLQLYKNAVSLNQALQAGSVELATKVNLPDVKTLQDDKNLVVEIAPSLQVYHVQFNPTKPALKDPRVRRALALSVDRAKLAEAATGGLGVPSQSIFPPDYEYSTDAMQSASPYDPAEAKRLLKEAGQEKVNLECVTFSGSGFEAAAPYLIEQIKETGFELDLEVTELSDALASFYNGDDLAKARKGPDCFFTVWPGQSTPRDAINAEYGKTIYNQGHTEYVSWDLLAKLDVARDDEERKKLVEQIELEAAQNPAMVTLYTRPSTFAHRKSVEGPAPDMLSGYLDLASMKPAE